jgi:hypothetical protein
MLALSARPYWRAARAREFEMGVYSAQESWGASLSPSTCVPGGPSKQRPCSASLGRGITAALRKSGNPGGLRGLTLCTLSPESLLAASVNLV